MAHQTSLSCLLYGSILLPSELRAIRTHPNLTRSSVERVYALSRYRCSRLHVCNGWNPFHLGAGYYSTHPSVACISPVTQSLIRLPKTGGAKESSRQKVATREQRALPNSRGKTIARALLGSLQTSIIRRRIGCSSRGVR